MKNHLDEKFNTIIEILEEIPDKKLRFTYLFELYKKKLGVNRSYRNFKNKKGKKLDEFKFSPSKTEFSNLLKSMINKGYLIKEGYHYLLSSYSTDLGKMDILQKSDKKEIYKKLFKNIIIQEILKERLKIVSEEKFDKFLSDLEIKKEDLKWSSYVCGHQPDIKYIIYPKLFPPPDSNYKKYIIKQIFKRNEKQVFLPLEFLCYPSKEYSQFNIIKTEYWELNKAGSKITTKLLHVEYKIKKIGFDLDEFNNSELGIDFPTTLSLLIEKGIIERIRMGKKFFYVIRDDELVYLLDTIKSIAKVQYIHLKFKMEYFDKLSESEKKNFEEFSGREELSRLEFESQIKLRPEHKKRMRNCKNIDEYIQILKEGCENEFEYSGLISNLNTFKGIQRKISKKSKKSKMELKKEVVDFYNYLKKLNDEGLKNLVINLEGEGVEHFKIFFEDNINKYLFLKEILYELCPKFFESADEEMREHIIKYSNLKQPEKTHRINLDDEFI